MPMLINIGHNDEIRRGGSDSRELARAVTRRLDCLVRRFLCVP